MFFLSFSVVDNVVKAGEAGEVGEYLRNFVRTFAQNLDMAKQMV